MARLAGLGNRNPQRRPHDDIAAGGESREFGCKQQQAQDHSWADYDVRGSTLATRGLSPRNSRLRAGPLTAMLLA